MGTVDKVRWHPPKEPPERLSDIAIVCLHADAPSGVARATFAQYQVTAPFDPDIVVYGFQSKPIITTQSRPLDDRTDWVSHPIGEITTGKISGPLPAGRAQLVGLSVTGPVIKKGYSGAGVYDRKQDAIVGMIVEADQDEQKKTAQFIDTPTLKNALVNLSAPAKSTDVLPKQVYTAIFWLGVLVFSMYPATVFGVLGMSNDALRWLKHNPAHNLFCLLLLPLAMALFATAFNVSVVRYIFRQSKISGIVSLVGLAIPGIYMAAAGAATKQFAEPFFFTDAVARASEDREYRSSLESSHDRTYKPSSFNGWENFFRRASVAAYISILTNAIANLFALFYLWYFIGLLYATRRGVLGGVMSGGKVPTQESWSLVMSFSLLISWFPMRIYSEWYASFCTLKSVLQYTSFWTFALLAILVQVAIWHRFSLSVGVRLSQLIYSVLVFAICILSIQNDLLLRGGRYVLNGLGDVGFSLTYSVVVGVLLVLIPMLGPETEKG